MNDIEMSDAGNAGPALPPGYEAALQRYVELSVLGMMGSQVEILKRRAELEFPILCGREYARYVSVNLQKKSLIIGTPCLVLSASDDSPRHRIGEFLLMISREPSTFTFENLTPLGAEYYHPHITSSGVMCMGTSDGLLRNLITDGRLLEVADNMWAVLNMLNNDKAHSNAKIQLWPLIEGDPG